ncbi:hypothetical protein PRUPE_1G415700 [Prunus persica]|uniref:Neprosin PEP catalytic domain-containing protein n=1 Tax=Prunus persica TaxID=3760 RepID=A0A251RBA1_PRUPE|nr:hypothetical protein PRUPE_1G415700 [Prunus persica]
MGKGLCSGEVIRLRGMKMMVIMLGVTVTLIRFGVLVEGDLFSKQKILEVERKLTQLRRPAVKTIQSEDGDIIDCIDIYKQPAFGHPALRNHTIQMAPTYDATKETKTMGKMDRWKKRNEEQSPTTVKQTWHKSGSCPQGTIPVRRIRKKELLRASSVKDHGRKKHSSTLSRHVSEFSDNKTVNLQRANHSVNPSVYGDRQTRFFVYWTVDGSKKTGCFDLTCPGFVQTSHEIALGAAIYPISVPNGLPYQIIVYIYKDPVTSNWWVQYGEKINVGYWPPELFVALSYHATSAEWGGEVYSSRVGTTPHTKTDMGSGHFADSVWGTSGAIRRIRIHENSPGLKFPDIVTTLMDEFNCYNVRYLSDYVEDPEFYYGGPGRNYMCP